MTHSHLPGARVITRRKFIAGFAAVTAVVAGTATGLVGLPTAGAAAAQSSTGQPEEGWLSLGPLTGFRPGIPQGFPYARRLKNGWLESRQTGIAYAVTETGEDVRVFANVCTHGGCHVTWAAEQGGFLCPCHAGLFGRDGSVLGGPPLRPLEELASRIVAGQVQIYLET